MQITSRTEYSVRALCELCLHDTPQSLRKISEAQKLPIKYLEHLFRQLKQSDLVSSVSGAKGGYFLNKDSKEISLYDIIEAVEDINSTTECDRIENSEYCIGKPCGFHQVWQEIHYDLKDYYTKISLEYIYQKTKEK
ncbi:MAG: Rrf2 family transcriptional regulator [Candidatus Cloacimonadales bacterium]|jgi:Rrf2 family protein|nr:Rrf2 family transcriptional regulator [Candidatus Cloacimonadota bacterium]MDD2650745.1 Rrf2 family transcriptional regulator [Candidatus Cloacimonadota bacterium]MDD3501327.1 Rrf2 family transcriptional regulator [Candidatus Cloacimonadota bacterium]MDX9977021.1 Rrf2 family transcriptional regulator [Candidatus Cloacimonadales bacterium]